MTTAKHTHTPRQTGEDRCYTGPVARPGDECPAAHGNIEITESCTICGAERRVLVNGSHTEVGPWGPTRAEREAAERIGAQRRQREQAAAECALAEARVRVTALDWRGWDRGGEVDAAYLAIDGRAPARYALTDLRAAATQPDTGDGLVPLYRGILTLIDDYAERDRAARSALVEG